MCIRDRGPSGGGAPPRQTALRCSLNALQPLGGGCAPLWEAAADAGARQPPRAASGRARTARSLVRRPARALARNEVARPAGSRCRATGRATHGARLPGRAV
eukprot:14947879-Alexandrium_andersonii.AAC.1